MIFFSVSINVTIVNSVDELDSKKELLKITDIQGREKYHGKNEVLFYHYKNGKVEKRIILE